MTCKQGYLNAGLSCMKSVEELPAIKVGAKFGGAFYVALIISTQFCGLAAETFLIRRVKRLGLLPQKEFLVLAIAMTVELLRMMIVDVFVLQDFFGGAAYRVYREPAPWSSSCSNGW